MHLSPCLWGSRRETCAESWMHNPLVSGVWSCPWGYPCAELIWCVNISGSSNFLLADLAMPLLVKNWHSVSSGISSQVPFPFSAYQLSVSWLQMIVAKHYSFSSKPWNCWPKQLAASSPLGRPFSKEIHDSSADGSLDQQAAPPTAKKTGNPSARYPSKDVNPSADMDVPAFPEASSHLFWAQCLAER